MRDITIFSTEDIIQARELLFKNFEDGKPDWVKHLESRGISVSTEVYYPIT